MSLHVVLCVGFEESGNFCSTGGTDEKGSYGELLQQHLHKNHHFHFGPSVKFLALHSSLECLHSFIWFDNPVKNKTRHAFQRAKQLRISAEKMQKNGTWLLRYLGGEVKHLFLVFLFHVSSLPRDLHLCPSDLCDCPCERLHRRNARLRFPVLAVSVGSRGRGPAPLPGEGAAGGAAPPALLPGRGLPGRPRRRHLPARRPRCLPAPIGRRAPAPGRLWRARPLGRPHSALRAGPRRAMPCGQPESGAAPARYVLGVDVGSTVVKCHVYDRAAAVRGSSHRKVESLYPRPGWVELDPEVLWSQFIGVIKEAVQAAGLHMRQIAGLGISTQRGTFITWHKRTGKPFHNFISWQDLRSAELVNSWNNSLLLKVIHVIFTVLHFLTGNDRYLAPSFLTFSTHQASMKLSWVFKNIHEAEEAAKKNNCCFGTVDTWLLYRLTKGSVYATDYSNASSTGIFEPFTKCWNPTLCNLLSIPVSIYPPVRDTSFNFGSTDSEIFGVPIPIMAVVADQQSAMFGECCFHPGDVKLTMGTGGFWNVNTGEHLFAARGSLYPLIGWKIGEEVVYLTEGSISDVGTAIKWALDIEFVNNVDETAEMAQSAADSQGVCFIPGLQVSGDDPYSCASFVGLKPSTNRNHLVRAILESVAFRNKLLYDIIVKKVHIPLRTIRADGGVSNNSFVMQMTSDLINKKIEKPANTEMSSLGAAFLAGLASGFWTDKKQLKKLRQIEAMFEPQKDSEEYRPAMDAWLQAMKHSSHR